MPETLTLSPGAVTLDQLERVWREGLSVRLDAAARPGIEASAASIARFRSTGAPAAGPVVPRKRRGPGPCAAPAGSVLPSAVFA